MCASLCVCVRNVNARLISLGFFFAAALPFALRIRFRFILRLAIALFRLRCMRARSMAAALSSPRDALVVPRTKN